MRASSIGSPDLVAASVEDLDQAREVGTRLFYPQRISTVNGHPKLRMAVRAGQIGPFMLGELTYGSDVRIDAGELETSYHVNLPLEGRLWSTHRGREVLATCDRAAVYGPAGRTVLSRWGAGSRVLCLKIDRSVVESTLSARLGREVARPITLDADLDLTTTLGRAWARLLIIFNEQLHQPGSLLYQPLAAAPLLDGLLNGLLCAVHHEFSEALSDEGRRRLSAPVVKKALDYIHANAAEPITTSDIAAHCCISVRALQENFAHDLNCSPMQYLRTVRLRRAHEDLLAADPAVETVARVAHRWGFTNAGRFATLHEAAFGERPGCSLRSSD